MVISFLLVETSKGHHFKRDPKNIIVMQKMYNTTIGNGWTNQTPIPINKMVQKMQQLEGIEFKILPYGKGWTY